MPERWNTIYEKAQQEKEVERLMSLLKSVEGLPEGSPERVDAYTAALKRNIAKMRLETPISRVWDFSHTKAQSVFFQDDIVTIRPVVASDLEFYISIKTQYSLIYRVILGTEPHKRDTLLQEDLLRQECFFCVIEDAAQTPIRYLGIKDTRKDIWEIAIELDGKYTNQGYGSHSIKLFLNEISRITGKKLFRAKVEVDNIPSQRCFKSIGAELMGLCNSGILTTPEERARFEQNNLNLIDDNIRALASRLDEEPRTLLSHVLEYRMTCPL